MDVQKIINKIKESNKNFKVGTRQEYGNNIIVITSKEQEEKEILKLYVKISNIDYPFWGITKNRIELLKRDKESCDYAVLLVGKNNYQILSSMEIENILSSKEVANDGDYKITLADITLRWEIQEILNSLFRDNEDSKSELLTGNLNVDIAFSYNSATNEYSIVSTKSDIRNIDIVEKNEVVLHTITETQSKFGILTLGAKHGVGKILPISTEIAIKINGENYTDKKIVTHKTVRGRIDGLTDLYSKFPQLVAGKEISVEYEQNDKILKIYAE